MCQSVVSGFGSAPAAAARPVVLLHGHPRTHATWHAVAPALAEHFSVICPDLRGYGRSSKPPTDAHHAPYSKRAMATDVVELMHRLGHERFSVVGHDRGAAVAFRLAMDPRTRRTELSSWIASRSENISGGLTLRSRLDGGIGSSSDKRRSPRSASSQPTLMPDRGRPHRESSGSHRRLSSGDP